ncbi:helix-turn-helix transcriptional regulator [Tengunoibacter tsumagoiensis]|uniref:Transcriptional regulator n=1 Tax=Tengunoibacter tsumagoiensis TaxID=2014871 RepID=A0A402A0W9_9CHLR|nr:YafY family protein [Tengunoibacter tsumagoiensis]GCE12725.1 transcriptional regulator [Tengunoibacter tsumagoiensis]
MYHPSTRLLTLLELLQSHAHLSGEELAERLEVEPRTVRRYIQMLQEMGMPVEGLRGPGGGYRLRPGFKLPPLLFTEEEATAVVLGLLGTPWMEIDFSSVAIEGALAKVYRVLPFKGRERLQSISTHLTLSPQRQETRPDASLLVAMSEAVREHKRVSMDYSSYHDSITRREIEPYGIAGWNGYWYVVGYCCLRQGMRLFRVDRIQSVEFLSTTFERDENFDCREYMVKHFATIPPTWQIEVIFQTSLAAVKQKIPASYGQLTLIPEGILFQTHHSHLLSMAHYLVGLELPFVVQQPPELRDALLQLAEQLVQIARKGAEAIQSPS